MMPDSVSRGQVGHAARAANPTLWAVGPGAWTDLGSGVPGVGALGSPAATGAGAVGRSPGSSTFLRAGGAGGSGMESSFTL